MPSRIWRSPHLSTPPLQDRPPSSAAPSISSEIIPASSRVFSAPSGTSVFGIFYTISPPPGERLTDPLLPRLILMIGSLLQDVAFSARTLLRRPGFTTLAVLTVALGIGINTAMFTIVNGV